MVNRLIKLILTSFSVFRSASASFLERYHQLWDGAIPTLAPHILRM
jgi:hypothetical protein